MRAAAGVRVGRSYLIGARRAPTQLCGTRGGGKRANVTSAGPRASSKHGLGRLEEPPADIVKNAILHVARISKNITSENRNT